MSQLDLVALAGRRIWLGIPGLTLDDATKRVLDDVRPGGVVLFRRNVQSIDQVTALCRALKAQLGPQLLISVDQEHGLVLRLDRELTVFPGNMALGAAGVREPSLAEHLAQEQGRRSAAELRAVGIDINLAPVCDLATRGDNPGLGVRSVSGFATLASRVVAAIVRGQSEGGVLSTLKHFPGLGDAAIDSHLDLPAAIAGDLDVVLAPFVAGIAAGAEIAMTTHVYFRDLDDGVPATFSRVIARDLLRGRLGFRGALMTDDLEMGAMTRRFGYDEVIRRACAAGHDVLSICHDAEKQRRAHELLRQAYAAGEAWAGDPVETTEHLDALRVPATAPVPDRRAAADLARAIAGRAVTVVRDPCGLIPLDATQPVYFVGTIVRGETQAEDPLRGEPLDVLLGGLPAGSKVEILPAPPTPADRARIVAAATTFGRVLIGTTLARFNALERDLVLDLAGAHRGAVVLALRNPFDLDVVPANLPAALVTAFGFRPVHQEALLSVLFGRVQPYGRLPVESRPIPRA